MITARKATIYVSDAGGWGPKKYHDLGAACRREAFYQLLRKHRRTMTENEFTQFVTTDDFRNERAALAKVIRKEFRAQEVTA